MELSELLDGILELSSGISIEVSGLSLNSREVQPGDLFFACKGAKFSGTQFIKEALLKGAVGVLTEETGFESPIFSIPNLSHKIGIIADRFYQHPSKKLNVIGVTGTNGKTSCSHFIAAALSQASQLCGVIGTLGSGFLDNIQPISLTTPDAITLQKTLAQFLTRGAKGVAMEVSSHSLEQGRVKGIQFEIGIFTNLSHDHLDYHGTMQAYSAAKKKLFEQSRHAVINADDAVGREYLNSIAHPAMFAYATEFHNLPAAIPTIMASNIESNDKGIKAFITTPWGEGRLQTSLIGKFNLSNLLSVLTTLCLLKVPFTTALNLLTDLQPIKGRMESVGGNHQPLVIVDYAHTPDALEKVLHALREHCHGKLYCLFGCGGERDRSKRPIMAKIAAKYADFIVVTDDNPRTENPDAIIAEIMTGFSHVSNVTIQRDRLTAIREIIKLAQPQDCVLIAGRGGELFQQIGNQKIPFSDIEKVKECLLSC